ncbi:TraB/GumN family protein [Cytobacillus depressus]|uniref:TraB/GumN family protein n=1 Tax=Cytobacillus depressus TaxID=1602942 RepID=A0A6L3VBU9_9BACI|nr:TraB/GumN family protein [Cytobacillus depressus]KAB2336683.1 TraB/GumN family protein [Cytobacillus depressus]
MKRMIRGAFAGFFTFVLMLTSIVPALAAEPKTPEISQWAVGELSEGEKYGIFPMEWYYDSFKAKITKERLNVLLAQTKKKIAALGLKKNDDYTSTAVNLNISRGNVINELYKIVAQYELPVGDSAVAYMQDRKILKGSQKGLQLDSNVTTEEAVIFATRLVKDTYYQAQAGSKGMAWKVENNGNKIYLLGSIHVGTPELYPIHEKLVTSFNEADALLVEADLFDAEGLQYFTEASMFQDGSTIKDVVSKETYEKLLKVLAKYEQPEEAFIHFKPWSLASFVSSLLLSESIGLPPEQMANSGIDMYFLLNAYLSQKPVIELEGMKAQTDMFEGLSPKAQEQYLVEALDSILDPDAKKVDESKLVKEWFDHWNKGNIKGFTESFNAVEGESSEFNDMLFGERDKNMTEKIAQLLESEEKGTYFLVVGAGHFVTPKSILFHLKEKGYKVEEFWGTEG